MRRYLGVLSLLSSEFNRNICFTAGVPCVRSQPSACVDSLDFGCYMPCKLPELICTGLNALLSWFSYNKLGSLTVLYIWFFVTIICMYTSYFLFFLSSMHCQAVCCDGCKGIKGIKGIKGFKGTN